MYLIYRGIRYELPSSVSQKPLPVGSSHQFQRNQVAVPRLVMLQYRGVSYARRITDLSQQPPDPDLESFIAAFWAIINA
ncbi:DUF4278 domain-containing protein [Oscillatoria sp. FACHB-1407]|uniref:DUF4278 domain-containing protein n=1 Tax=Oscillatoria sp. FACHB-1407 TaxID=2692847 RepID=UPI0016891794|nr:DUF4278 domain-containing protein [Oscillatoria sp. FACHB-1407]MBD2461596.1 DUF4278 domain-containing protein [Oscillatoria sp. FACHB-1407]